MKDIYELLNDIHTNISDDDFASVSEFEKKRFSKELQNRIVKTKKQNKFKRSLTVAAMTLGIICSSLIGLSFTSYAQESPFLGSIFKFFSSSDGNYADYEEHAKKLGLVQESNGIKISIMDTIFDGETLFITYMIETTKDLGDRPWLNSLPMYGDSGLTSSEQISKIEDGKYISLMSVNDYHPENLDDINVNWQIESISTHINNTGTVYEGNWAFDFHLSAVDSKTILVNKTLNNHGLSFTANHIKITPMSFIISYEGSAPLDIFNKWDHLFMSMEVMDDLGNKYKALNGTTRGWGIQAINNWSATYESLDPNATKLFITPIIELSENDIIGKDEVGNPLKANYRSIESNGDLKKVQFEEIIVDLK